MTSAAMPPFACDRCGACCRSLALHALYQPLDRGDGVCRHFDDASGLCAVYAERPLQCRIDAAYDAGLVGGLTRSEYHAATRAACDALRARTAPSPQQEGETGRVPGAT
ncbi:YkgJ family cysteine cluster protein [Azospirillum soli]|uniref:YkgJ family cysteine cluster protein n=1 Tax=Azospirillum soli TaxID=1304799 RepID=UPI001AEB3F92